jgi:CrcB protein
VDQAGRDGDLPVDPDLAVDADLAVDPRRARRPQAPARPSLDVVAVVAVGGILGTAARYGMSRALPTAAGGFPWATFWTNISGSLALGLLLAVLVAHPAAPHRLRPFLATGFLGAYTTFSTFVVETDLLVRDDHPGTAVAYAVSTIVVGLAAAWFGIRLGGRAGRRS